MKKVTLYLIFLLSFQFVISQDNGVLDNFTLTPITFIDPSPRLSSVSVGTLPLLSSGVSAIEFILTGGDGGTATWDGIFTDLMAQGGVGGTVTFTLPITPENEGQQLFFHQGKRGESFSHPILASGGGGGSTAITDSAGNVYAIAGGGGGGSAVEIRQSNGLPGGTALGGVISCGLQGNQGDTGTTGQNTRSNLLSIVNGPFTSINVSAGGGGGLTGVPNNGPAIHQFDIAGKSAEAGGAGGNHPVASFQRGEDCDPGNPFGLGCSTVTTWWWWWPFS